MFRAIASIVGAATLILCVAFAWYLTGDFRRGSGFFPYIVLTLIGFTSLLWLARSFGELRAGPVPAQGEAEADLPQESLGTLGGYAVLAMTVVYGSAVVMVGYVIPSMIFMACLALFLRGRRFIVIALVSVIFPLSIYYLLTAGFQRPLPF